MVATYPPPPGLTGSGTTLDTLTTSDTFRSWFDRTNQVIDAVNPLAIYGITTGPSGSDYDGITIAYNTETGNHAIGFSTPAIINGNTTFTGSITFSGPNILFSGGTVDFTGSTLYGNVVRTVNGETGDVTIAAGSAQLPSGAAGNILVFNATSSTYEAQEFFTGITKDAIYVTDSGAIIVGATTDGNEGIFDSTGQLQLVAITSGNSAGIFFQDASYSGTNLRDQGLYFEYGKSENAGKRVFQIIPGGTSGVDLTNAPFVTLSNTDRSMGLFGITNPSGYIHYLSRSGGTSDVILENSEGEKFTVNITPQATFVSPNEMKVLKLHSSTFRLIKSVIQFLF